MVVALVAGMAGGALVTACARRPPNGPRRDEVMALWTQIRDWRREAGIGVEPAASTVQQMAPMTVARARRMSTPCPTSPPRACHDVCSLADAICDNAERICDIAAELDDGWASEKCNSAKASCREATERCCTCEDPDEP
jgi:hypothetical protein